LAARREGRSRKGYGRDSAWWYNLLSFSNPLAAVLPRRTPDRTERRDDWREKGSGLRWLRPSSSSLFFFPAIPAIPVKESNFQPRKGFFFDFLYWIKEPPSRGQPLKSVFPFFLLVSPPSLFTFPSPSGASKRADRGGLSKKGIREILGNKKNAVTWLILPVVICLSQRLSHACLSINEIIQ